VGKETYTYNSATNITATWDDGIGSGPGASVQLNFSGASSSWTPTAVTEWPDAQGAEFTMPSAWGTPTDDNTGCPDSTFATFVNGGAAGKWYALIRCGSTGNNLVKSTLATPSNIIVLIGDPVVDGYHVGDTLAIFQSEAVLQNGAAAQSVTLAPDYRLVPSSTQTDTGISIAVANYCAGGICSGALDPQLPGGTQNDSNSFLWGTTNAPVNGGIAEPLNGGDMTNAFRAGSPYQPKGLPWRTAGHSGGPIGATTFAPFSSTLSGVSKFLGSAVLQ